MRVFLVSPYHGGSHRAWAEGYATRSGHEVHLITMRDRFWKWRMHGGSVTLAEHTSRLVAEVGRPDVVLCTDMVDVAGYLGLARLGDVGVVTYFHENQLLYPVSDRSRDDLTYGFMNWKSMVGSDLVLFNSEFHRQALFAALPAVLKNFPDHRHLHLVDGVAAKSAVLPVGIDLGRFPPRSNEHLPVVLWNQRWDHDKNPEEMIAALDAVVATGRDFRIAVCGENSRQRPQEFEAARRRWGERVSHFGWAPAGSYERLLASADIVFSTAHHEFFGVGVVEAMSCGAWGILPDRLSYPELLPPASTVDHLYGGFDDLVARLGQSLDDVEARRAAAWAERTHYDRYDWSVLAPRYDRVLSGTPSGGTVKSW